MKILDTHLGSGSIAIAIDALNKIEKMNLTLTACELDKDYYKNAVARIEEETKWNSLFA
jgi:site-specific DNA-methyltransferase (adenine-specific)